MNKYARQNYLRAAPLYHQEIANDVSRGPTADAHAQHHTPDYIQFRNMMRAEKRQSFWSGVALTSGIVIALSLFLISMSASGKSFMTCHEYGETFTCRLGGL